MRIEHRPNPPALGRRGRIVALLVAVVAAVGIGSIWMGPASSADETQQTAEAMDLAFAAADSGDDGERGELRATSRRRVSSTARSGEMRSRAFVRTRGTASTATASSGMPTDVATTRLLSSPSCPTSCRPT